MAIDITRDSYVHDAMLNVNFGTSNLMTYTTVYNRLHSDTEGLS